MISRICKLLIFIIITSIFNAQVSKAQDPIYNSGIIIVLDPGHGGKDQGAVGKNCSEKQLTLSICKKIQQIVTDKIPDVAVYFTRQTDTFIPLHERARFANDLNADYFISIHCNAIISNQTAIRGSEIYVMGLHKAEENLLVAKRENEAIFLEEHLDDHYFPGNFEHPESFIMLNHIQDQYLNKSIKLANAIDNSFVKNHPGKSKGVKQAGFHVLHQVSMPGILIECGYMSHPAEEKYLCSTEGQWEIANLIAAGIYNHLLSNPVYPLIAEKSLAIKGNSPSKIPEEFIYKIQLASSNKPPVSNSKWLSNPNFEIIKEDQLYRLVYGSFLSIEEARIEKEHIISMGFKDAFILKYPGN